MVDEKPLGEVWARTFNQVQQEVDIPTVWLAMQAVRPLAIDGSRFVATMAPDLRYLAVNLETSDTAHAIEHALEEIVGHPLAFLIIEGQTIDDWQKEKAALQGSYDVPDVPVFMDTEWTPDSLQFDDFDAGSTVVSPPTPTYAPSTAQEGGFISWESLNEYITHEFKAAPMIRYVHGQAAFLVRCARAISDTMDRLMPAAGQPHDNAQERHLSKTIDRLASMLTLDSFFVALEIMRYRYSVGRRYE
jgi:hypothetical protein